MAKYCVHCYTPASDDEMICKSCGKPLEQKDKMIENQLEDKQKKKVRFPKEVRQTFFYNFWSLLFFEFLFYLAGEILIKNASSWVLNKALIASGINFVEGTNLFQALTNPVILLTIIFLIALNGFFIGIELFALVLYAHESYHRRKLAPLNLTKTAFKRTLKIFKPKNWLFFPVIMLVMPFLGAGTSNYLSLISIPGFIMQYIQASGILSLLYVVVLIILGAFVLLSCFYMQFFVLTADSFCQSIGKSFKLMKKRFLRTCGNTLWTYIVMALIVAGVLLILLLILFLILGFYTDLPDLIQELINGELTIVLSDAAAIFTGTAGRLIGFASLATFSSILIKALVLLFSPFAVCTISVSFYHYQREDGDLFIKDRLISDAHGHFWKTRRKIFLVVLMVAAIFVYKSAVLYTGNYSSKINTLYEGAKTCAHRGDSISAPENSRAAILSAIEKGADYVEIDVAQTKDGVLVVSHDNNISRVTGRDINICDVTWDEIKDLDTGSWFDPKFSDQRFMTLDEAMDLCDGRIKMNIELKPTGNEENFEENCVRVFQAHHFYSQGFFASLNANTLLKVEALDPKIDTCLNSFVALGALELLPVDIYSVEATFVNESLVDRIKTTGKKIWVWTVNNESLVDQMITLDVNAIVTDDPVMTKKLIRENEMTSERIFYQLIISAFVDL